MIIRDVFIRLVRVFRMIGNKYIEILDFYKLFVWLVMLYRVLVYVEVWWCNR